MTTTDGILDRLADGARGVLDANWLGASTLPSRTLYPHQWSWDSAFIALGRAWYDEARAQQELRSLFRAQWADGRVPHIVFNPSVGEEAYFPGPAFWQSSKRSAAAPRDVETSGITQPPIHARAALEMHRHARDVEGSKAFLGVALPTPRRRARLSRPAPPARWLGAAGVHASMGVRPGQLAGLGPRPRADGHPGGRDPALRPPRPRPCEPRRPADQRGLRPVRVPGRRVPGNRL